MHSFFRSPRALPLCVLILGSAPALPAQTAPAPRDVVKLDAFVVSSGLDDRSAFDLAQGTSILTPEELRQKTASTLGDLLSGTPGVNSTSFGPGASRPVIRGLGGDRVRMLGNGIGSLDASSVSPDHNTALEPLFATSVEVLRGPATLLYGGSAVGGAVNVIDNSVPAEAASRPVSGTVELRGGGAGRERTGLVALTAGAGEMAYQFNALTLRSRDLAIPGVARIDAAAPAGQVPGTLPNSAIRTRSGSLGASFIGADGHIGGALSTLATKYGVPAGEPISIDLHQRRLDLAAEFQATGGRIRGVRGTFGLGDYEHREVADGTTINTTFRNQAWEGRLELPHALAANLTGTTGVQATRSDFAAAGEEVVTPASVTATQAVFVLEELKLAGWTLQAGGRLERQVIRLGGVDPALPAVPGYAARTGERSAANAASASAGAVFYPATDWSIGASLAYTERLPTAQERYSNGPHGGTGAWEVGSAGLGRERSLGLDVSVRRRAGFVTGSVGVFVNRFRDYVFEQALPAGTIPPASNPEGLAEYQFVAKDAEFRGAEAEVSFHLRERDGRHVHLDLTSDFVRAEQTTDAVPLPRIPPLRIGARLRLESTRWQVALEARHVARQGRTAPAETATPGHTLLNLNVAWHLPLAGAGIELFARGENLANREGRSHASFLKDFAPLPGRGVTLGLRATF